MAEALSEVDIESVIPHRDRIKMISEVLEMTDDTAVTAALVKPTWPLCNGATVNPIVLIEVIAQTAAVIDGIKRKKQGKSGGKGWLVGVKNAKFNITEIPVGTKLIARVRNSYSFDNYSVIEGTVYAGEENLALIVLQALRMNEDQTND
jgi:predicted hotdog family 3-hydroxylacyl-ACP dehydratase